MNTVDVYKARKEKNVNLLTRLLKTLEEGEQYGVTLDSSVKEKLEKQISETASDKLKVALVGGFSEGKTSIVAAWLGQFDKETMKINQSESSDEVEKYEFDDLELVDTPGLFGFKETSDNQKYKDITEKYVSESNIILYVMNSANPIKESHKALLQWLFKDLDILTRTVFVLSRFDEVTDIEDKEDYADMLKIKQDNVTQRLKDFDIIQSDETLPIVAVSANPFDEGLDYWLKNRGEYDEISHIPDLQKATTDLINHSGGAMTLELQTQKSVFQDIIQQKVPLAELNLQKGISETEKYKQTLHNSKTELDKSRSRIEEARTNLKEFITNYFSDLILQVSNTSMETFSDFFERNIGSEGVVLDQRIDNEFSRQLGSVTDGIARANENIYTGIQDYNNVLGDMALNGLKMGGEFLKRVKGIEITGAGIKAARDVVFPALKFKPWGAMKLAGNLEGLAKGLPIVGQVIGIGVEVWGQIDEARKQQEFNSAIAKMKSNFEKQRAEYLDMVSDTKTFIDNFFPQFLDLESSVKRMEDELSEKSDLINHFQSWKKEMEVIDGEFTELN
ncbi:LeoA/HP0731 family dynamin-like GTPase [Weissella confusa]